jgi:hypothetical protein
MFIKGKGDRKFCSECSKNRQTYQGRKDYLREKRMEYYRYYKAQKARNGKQQLKGKTHGKTTKG